MTAVVKPKLGDLETFNPEKYKLYDAAADYTIEHAKRIKDWPKLEEAVDLKIGEQRKFVAWWGANVGVLKGGDRKSKKSKAMNTAFDRDDAEDLTGMKHQRVSDLDKRLGKTDKYRNRLLGAEYRAAMLEVAENVRGTQGTGENEWYTPLKYIDMARRVLGEIDLDPASSYEAQKNIQAARFYTKETNGLTAEWHGRVWLNPPYAQPFIAEFASKMVHERRERHVSAAIMLTHNYTDTAWFHEAAEIVDAICFTRGRIRFMDSDGNTCAPTQGQAFFYYGDDVRKFTEEFVSVGFVVVHA
jgi:phage N-6-adenine-methyltransferase